MAPRVIYVALVCCVALALAQDQGNGLSGALGTGNPFTNPEARALQFGQASASEVDFCLGRDVSFGGDTTFESWIYPTKPNGAIFTAVTLDGSGAPYNDDTISFRLINWNTQLFLGGYPIGNNRTNIADITSVKVSSPNMVLANAWTRIFGTVSTSADSTKVCVYSQLYGATDLDGGCVNADIAWPTKVRSHLYVGDGSILGLDDLNYRGLIENLRIWRKALSTTDILALTTVPAADPNVVASWSFDECPVVGNKVVGASDTSGSSAPVQLNCGNNDPAKQPICVRTNSPVTQAGGFLTNPPVVGNLGSGNTVKPTPPPTTKPPTTKPHCPKAPNADFWGDPHMHINGGEEIDFYGAGWFWGARTENWAKEEFGFQLYYERCNGDKTCGAGIAWVNKRELGWYKYGEQLGLVQDTTNIPFRGPVMTTPAGTQIEQRGWGSITVTVPGYFTVVGSNDQWTITVDDDFEGLLADGTCMPVNDQKFLQRPVASGDVYYKGTSPPVCTDCPVPPALQPPVCPQASTAGAACDGPTGVPCTWSARCSCIAQICWNTDLVSTEHRQSCLVDTSGTGAFNPALAVPSIDATWNDCLAALDVFRATNPDPTDARYAGYKCYRAQKCPAWCSGPCQGTCDLISGTCTCKAGFGGADCSQAVGGKKRQEFDSVSNEIVAKFTSYFGVNAFYGYDSTAKSASVANPVAAPKTASFFLHSQVAPPYLISGANLNAGDAPVNSFGVVINSASSPYSGKLALSVKLVDAATGAAITNAAVSIKDDPSDTYTWNAATGSGSFSWSFGTSGSAGVVISQLPSADFCAQITITSATGVDRFVAVSNEVSDYSVPILSALPVAAGSSFEICSVAPSDSCNLLADCGSCNARPECGWCASTGMCHRGDEVGPYYTTCTVWRSETDPTVSRLVESRRDTTLNVRTTQIRTYLAPDNAQLTVPVEVRIPATVGSVAFQVRGLFEFTDQMAPFAKFLGTSGSAIIDGIQAASPGSLFGVSSFRDKAHVRPHGRAGDWIYKEHVAFQKTDVSATPFTADWSTWAASPNLVADWQFDLGLATLEALFHESHQGWPLHPVAGTKNVVLVFTKSPVAQAGINVDSADSSTIALGEPLPANNLDQVVDDYEDYPALSAVAEVLLSSGIIPVFVVPDAVGTEEIVASYRSLVAKLGFGKVWPDAAGRNALKSTMTSAQASAVITSILADLVTSVQIVATNPAVTSTLASPVLFSGDNYPLGAVVKVPITLQRQTAASRKRDLDAELFRLFYRDRQSVTVVGLGQFEVVSTTTDAPSAENTEFSINVGETDPVAHVLTLPSWSVYDQNMKGYIVTMPTASALLYNILAGASPEAKGAPLATSGLIDDTLHRVYIDIPATAVGDAANGYLYSTFTFKMVDSCGMESGIATVNVRVVPAGMHAPMRYEPTADFLASVNENTKWAPTSTLVCVGGIDYDPQSTISVKITRTPTEGTLYHIVDSKGTAGAIVQTNDVVTSTFNARPAPAVGCFVYVPPVRSPGMETPYGPAFGNFQWMLLDNTGLFSAPETTNINVIPVNYPPVTSDATVTGWENSDLNVNLVASDDPRPDGINNNMAVSVKISTLPTRGVLKTKDGITLSASNPTIVLSLTNGVPVSVIYTPDANKHSDADASGSLMVYDFFTYTATDAGGLTSTASVRVLINPANALPVVAFSNAAWTFPVANNAGFKDATSICFDVSNLRDAASTAVYITALPTKGSVSVNGVAAIKAPVALVSTSASMGNAGSFCFDYAAKKAGTDTLAIKVCTGCPAPTDASFTNYLNGAASQTVTIQNGSQKSASSSGLSKGGVIAVAVVGSLLGLALLGFLAFLVIRSSASASSSSSSSNSSLKAPLL